jgi:hypothetical protein
MLKKITTLAVFAAAIAVAAANAHANTIAGRVTSFSPSSISVLDKEVVTVGMNGATAFTKLIIQKPWQADTALTANALAVGRYVIVHADFGIANWVQVAMDRPVFAERAFTAFEPRAVVPPVFATDAARHRAEAAALRAGPNASESKRPGSPGTAVHCDRMADRLEKAAGVNPGYAAPGSAATAAPVLQAGDILSEKALTDLIANAKTPADHKKIARHYTAYAAKNDADAAEHVAEAKAYRKAPTASESKRPAGPDTAVHCDRLADLSREIAKTARELARYHEGMAK